MTLVLILGGARSGKSRYAERLAERSGAPVTYLATAGPPRDAEMAARIARHQADRPDAWTTVEEADAIEPVLRATQGMMLVDCLTLWLTNVMLADGDVPARTKSLVEALSARKSATIAVSNETGKGIVPATPLGRAFRDAQGVLNQAVAAAADHVVLMVAGQPLALKPRPEPEISL